MRERGIRTLWISGIRSSPWRARCSVKSLARKLKPCTAKIAGWIRQAKIHGCARNDAPINMECKCPIPDAHIRGDTPAILIYVVAIAGSL